jgi:hypothetical protein
MRKVAKNGTKKDFADFSTAMADSLFKPCETKETGRDFAALVFALTLQSFGR